MVNEPVESLKKDDCAYTLGMAREAAPVYRIQDLSASERPRERLERVGAQSLSEAELLAILLRTGVKGENAVQLGQRLLNEMGGLHGLQANEFSDLAGQHGIGKAKTAQIKAALELGRRMQAWQPEERPAITSPRAAAELVLYEMSAFQQEHLRVILLDTRNKVLGIEEIYKGTLNMSTVRIGEIFRAAIKRNTAGVIVVHNHPSGDPQPSPEDVTLTRALVQAGKLLDIPVLDHLVIGHNRWSSMKEKGLGF